MDETSSDANATRRLEAVPAPKTTEEILAEAAAEITALYGPDAGTGVRHRVDTRVEEILRRHFRRHLDKSPMRLTFASNSGPQMAMVSDVPLGVGADLATAMQQAAASAEEDPMLAQEAFARGAVWVMRQTAERMAEAEGTPVDLANLVRALDEVVLGVERQLTVYRHEVAAVALELARREEGNLRLVRAEE